MAIFPKVQSPCPYKDRLSEIIDGDTCRLCKRQVVDLTVMSDSERVAFMKGCAGEVCVTYRYSIRPAVAAAIATATVIASQVTAVACETTETTIVITGGGIKDPANAEYFQDASESATAELPVVYETTASAKAPRVDEDDNTTMAKSPLRPAPLF